MKRTVDFKKVLKDPDSPRKEGETGVICSRPLETICSLAAGSKETTPNASSNTVVWVVLRCHDAALRSERRSKAAYN